MYIKKYELIFLYTYKAIPTLLYTYIITFQVQHVCCWAIFYFIYIDLCCFALNLLAITNIIQVYSSGIGAVQWFTKLQDLRVRIEHSKMCIGIRFCEPISLQFILGTDKNTHVICIVSLYIFCFEALRKTQRNNNLLWPYINVICVGAITSFLAHILNRASSEHMRYQKGASCWYLPIN